MTLRGVFGGDVQHIQEQIDDLLDREDGLIVLFDGESNGELLPGIRSVTVSARTAGRGN
jgi:hypothetical protein